MSEAGPSRPRKPSQSSIPPPQFSSQREREYRNTTPGTSVFDADAYDEDADALPGYATPGRARGNSVDGKQGRRDSAESLLPDSAGSTRDRGGGGRGGAGGRRESVGGDEGFQVMEMGPSVAQRRASWWRSTLITALFVCAWYGSATLLSIYNKWMFSPQYYNFPFPLFVTACHMVVQFALAAIVRIIWREKYRPVERPSRQDYVAKIFPTAFSTAGDIGLSNLSLRTITLSLYSTSRSSSQILADISAMCKASALIFVLLFAFLFRLERFSLHLVGVITLITAGVFLMVFDTTAVNVPGIIMVFSASALSGLRWALTETIMKKKSMGLSNPFATIFWLAPLMALVLIPVSIGVEGLSVFRSGHFDKGSAMFTCLVIAFPGTVAFAMVSSEYFIIHRAGILPLSVAGVFKEVTTISISAWIFGDQLTKLNIVGVAIAVCGIALYSYYKYQKAMSASSEEDLPILPPHSAHPNQYSLASSADADADPNPSPSAVPMSQLPSNSSDRDHIYPPTSKDANEPEEREGAVQKRIDDFEGWNEDWSEGEDGEDEGDEEEVMKQRRERIGESGDQEGSWGKWWDKDM